MVLNIIILLFYSLLFNNLIGFYSTLPIIPHKLLMNVYAHMYLLIGIELEKKAKLKAAAERKLVTARKGKGKKKSWVNKIKQGWRGGSQKKI